ncbi:MAG: DMT family transporter [Thalassovita sp.]
MILAALLALTAGALFGFNVHIHRKGLDGADGLTGAFLSVISMAVMFWVVAPFVVEWSWFGQPGALIFAISGIFFPAVGQTFQIFSVQRVGPALTAALGSFVPVLATVPAILFLGESFGPRSALALTLMVGGLVLSAMPSRGITRSWPLWALAFPLGAATVRGFSQPAMKLGMETAPSPFFAAMITSGVSAVVLAIILMARDRGTRRLVSGGAARRWFMLSGVINGVGILSLNGALSKGDVTVVAPLAATAPLWALLFGALVFRRETLRPRNYLIAALVVTGAAILVTQ